MYLEGKGVARNTDIALELLQMAADQIPTAHNFIGMDHATHADVIMHGLIVCQHACRADSGVSNKPRFSGRARALCQGRRQRCGDRNSNS